MLARIFFCFSLILGFLFALGTNAGATIFDVPNDLNAKFSVEKNLCLGDLRNDPTASLCPLDTVVPANSTVSYIFTVTNPWGEPPQRITLDDNYPNSFVPSGAPVCLDDTGNAVTLISGAPAPAIAEFDLGIGKTVTCVVAGEFNNSGTFENTVNAKNNSGYDLTSKVSTTVAASQPLGVDLSLTKTVSPSSINVSSNSQDLNYTIKIKNNGSSSVFIGDHFKLHDRMSLLPNSVPFRARFVSATCTSSNAGTTDCLDPADIYSYGSPDILVGTAGVSNFIRWGFSNGKGNLGAGETITLTIKARISQLNGLSCVAALNADGIRNQAFFTLIDSSGSAFTESNASNNSASVNAIVVTGQTTVDPYCGKGHLKITKTQVNPNPQTELSWGDAAGYEIELENKSVPAQNISINIGDLQDWVTEGINTPPFTRVHDFTSCTSSTDSAVCAALNGAFAASPDFSYTYYTQTEQAWKTSKSFTLQPGHKVTIGTKFFYKDPDCETVPKAPLKPIINTATVSYKATAYGATSASDPKISFFQSAKAVTKMKDNDACDFKVKKASATTAPNGKPHLFFGTPFKYDVVYTSNEPKRDIGTITDAIRLDKSGYAGSLDYTSSWSCTATGVSGYKANGSITGKLRHTSTPAQGSLAMNLRANSATPINFTQGGVLTCKVTVTVDKPATGSNYCTSAPVRLQNTALMDVTHPFNSNIAWPPSGTYQAGPMSRPNPQNKNWAMADAHMPKCVDAKLNKDASVPGLPGGAPWTYDTGPQVDYAITVTNLGQSTITPAGSNTWPFPGLMVEDDFDGIYAGSNRTNSTCLPGGFCSQPTSNNAGRQIGVTSLGSLQDGTWTYSRPNPFTTGVDIKNCAALNANGPMNPSQGYYYTNFSSPVSRNGSTPQSDCATVPVLQTTEINISKEVIDETGANATVVGPFEFTATCSPYELFAGTEKVSVNAGSTGTIKPVPVKSNCTIEETSLPPVPQAAIDACEAKSSLTTAQWETSITPSSLSTPLNPNGVTVEAVNKLVCTEAEKTALLINKTVSGPDPKGSADLRNLDYSINVDCTDPITPDTFTLKANSQQSSTVTVEVSQGTTCTLSEVTPAFPQSVKNLCPAPQVPVWDDPTYVKANPVVIGQKQLRVQIQNNWKCDIGTPVPNTAGGFDDMAVWRPSSGMWIMRKSSNNFNTVDQYQWGTQGDIPLARTDMTGDGLADLVVWRPSARTWYTKRSPSFGSFFTRTIGTSADDQPIPSTDLNDDGYDDMVTWNPNTGVWSIRMSPNYNTVINQTWGVTGDIPMPGTDMDGDGNDDLVVWRPSNGTWYGRLGPNFTQTRNRQWGSGTLNDIPFPGSDFNGDGASDPAVLRPGAPTVFVRPTAGNTYGAPVNRSLGVNTGTTHVIPGSDFDGDSRSDMAVWHEDTGNWHIRGSNSGFGTVTTVQWGTPGDVPFAGADFNGDGFTDIGVFRAAPNGGTFFVRLNTGSGTNISFGAPLNRSLGKEGDIVVVGPFDNP